MGVTEVHDQLIALLGGTIANAVDFERLLVAFADADDHVVQQRTGHAVQRAVQLVVGGALDMDGVAVLLQDHLRTQGLGQGALRALDGNNVVLRDGDFHTGGDGNALREQPCRS